MALKQHVDRYRVYASAGRLLVSEAAFNTLGAGYALTQSKSMRPSRNTIRETL